MKRGELYRVRRPPGDPKPARVFVVVSRQPLIDSTFSTVVCAPVFTLYHGLPTQVSVGTAEGLKHESAIQCDSLFITHSLLVVFSGGRVPTPRVRASFLRTANYYFVVDHLDVGEAVSDKLGIFECVP